MVTNPAHTYSADDFVNPVYCIICRAHIPVAVSNTSHGLCPHCVQAGSTASAVKDKDERREIAWGDTFFASLALVDVLRQITFQPLTLFATAFAGGLGGQAGQAQNAVDKYIGLMYLTVLAMALIVCGAIGTILGRRWGYATLGLISCLISGMLLIILIQGSNEQGPKLMNGLGLLMYGLITGYTAIRLAARQ